MIPGWWQAFKDFYLVYLPLRFNIILVALIGYAFLLNAQGHDIIARLVGQKDPSAAIAFDCFVLLLALQLWFWSRQLLYLIPQNPPASRFPFWTRWIPRLLGILVFVIAFLALLRVGATPTRALTAYIVVLAIYFVLFVVFVIVRRKMLATPAHAPAPSVTLLSTQAKAIFIASAVLYVAFFAFSFSTWAMVKITSPVIVLLVAAIWVSVGVVIIYLGHRWGMPLFTFLIVFALLISPLADNHELATLGPSSYARQDPAAAFDAWVKSRPGFQKDYPVFFVMTEGGGIRAAYWTAAVLGALHDQTHGAFTAHTFAISGISGGSVGAAVFDVAVATHAPSARAAGKSALKYDALAPTLASFLVPDLLQRFIPAPVIRRDRARALEIGWERGWKEGHNPAPEALEGGFLDLFAKNGNLPALLLSGTVVETGQRSVTSNFRIRWGDALDTFDQVGTDLRISTAALTSARFPIISPAGTMIRSATATSRSPVCEAGAKCGHLVDGGYFESSGAATLIELMTMLRSSPQSSASYAQIKPYIILIQYENPSPVTSATFALETTAPLRALGSTLGARPVFVVNRLAGLGTAVHFDLGPNKPELPLGWLLSEDSMSWMDGSIEKGANQQCVQTINAMLQGTPPAPGSCAAPLAPAPVAPLEVPQEK